MTTQRESREAEDQEEEEVSRDVELVEMQLPTYLDNRGRRRAIEPDVIRMCEMVAYEGMSMSKAADAIGMDKVSAWRRFQNEGVRAYLKRLCEEQLDMMSGEALAIQRKNMYSADKKASVAAAKDLLDRAELRGRRAGTGGGVRINITLGDGEKQAKVIDAEATRYEPES